MKKYILDNLPTIWVVAVFVLGMALVANHANAGEKTKQEWNALYAEAGCSGEGRWHDQDRNESASGFKFLIEAILGKEGEQ